jgi:hypothetical protein
MLEINPLLSILTSLLIINGIYNLAKFVSKSKYLIFLENYAISGRIISFFLIINFLSILLYNFFLLFGINEFYLKTLATLFILIGFYKPDNIQEIIKKYVLINTKTRLLLFLIISGYFFISLLPITDPDSLDYHITVPYLSLINGSFFIQKEWLTSQLSGAGEALIILGLSLNAFKFSSVLQFIGLFIIILSILNLRNNKKTFNSESKILVCLAILCIPSFLFLVFTSKSQLFSISSNFLAFLITFIFLPFEKNRTRQLKMFAVVVFLCLSSTQFKFSFFLSSGIIISFAFFEMLKKKIYLNSILIILFFALFIIFPREYYDYKFLDDNIINNFFSPIANDLVSDNFVSSLKHGVGNPRYLPYWLFFPFQANNFNLGAITQIIGLSVILFIINFKFKPVKKIIYATSIFFIFAIPFAQSTGRFFIEPFLWLLVGSLYYLNSKNNLILKIFRKFIFVNSISIFVIILFTIFNFSPSILSINNQKKILSKYADGYDLYNWANKTLPDDAIVLTSHRSFLFSEKKFLSYNFRLYVETQEELDYFIDLIIEKKPTHILYNSFDLDRKRDFFKNCRGKLFAKKKGVQKAISRNPFNKKNVSYDGYIYEIDLDKLNNCKII